MPHCGDEIGPHSGPAKCFLWRTHGEVCWILLCARHFNPYNHPQEIDIMVSYKVRKLRLQTGEEIFPSMGVSKLGKWQNQNLNLI